MEFFYYVHNVVMMTQQLLIEKKIFSAENFFDKKKPHNIERQEIFQLFPVTNGVANFIWKGKCSESIS